jgi:CRP/FNR family transcriptional regulator, cyclic AMP receptor protein
VARSAKIHKKCNRLSQIFDFQFLQVSCQKTFLCPCTMPEPISPPRPRAALPTSADGRPAPDFAEFLKTIPMFNAWSVASVMAITQKAKALNYRPGELIEFNMQTADTIHIVGSGVVGTRVTIANGQQLVMAYVQTGFAIGIAAAFAPGPPNEQQEYFAHTDVMAWRIPVKVFRDCFWQDRAVAESTLRHIAITNRLLVDELANCTLLSARARVARYLLMMRFQTELWNNPIALQLDLTQADVARVLGLSRQSVGSFLREFESLGLIDLGRQKIVVLKTGVLQKIVMHPG